MAEDDAQAADDPERPPSSGGHTLHVVSDREALSPCPCGRCDRMVPDRMRSGMDGLAVLKARRAGRSKLPVILWAPLADVDPRVDGLKAGGDDYPANLVRLAGLSARIGGIARRPAAAEARTSLRVFDPDIDLVTRTATRQVREIALQSKALSVVEVLMRNAGGDSPQRRGSDHRGEHAPPPD